MDGIPKLIGPMWAARAGIGVWGCHSRKAGLSTPSQFRYLQFLRRCSRFVFISKQTGLSLFVLPLEWFRQNRARGFGVLMRASVIGDSVVRF
jgi:hypothetical protein